MIDIDLIPSKFIAFRDRWGERDVRMATMVEAVNGRWHVDGPDDDAIVNRSPNMIQIALEDTAEASSIIPTVRVGPSGTDDEAKDRATAMERMGLAYMDVSQKELLTIRSIMDLAAFGLHTWLVYYDPETGSPTIQWRDPATCFPEPGWKTMDSVRECFFAREVFLNQLKPEWQDKIRAIWPDSDRWTQAQYLAKKVTLIEYFTEEEWLIAALYQSSPQNPRGGVVHTPVELARGTNPDKICPVVIGQRITIDNEPRGQFDQVVGLMEAHIRIMGMVLDYADQAVYSDVWVKDLIGPLNFGGGAYIQLGPNGQIGRVPPAVTDLTVFRELEQLIDAMHLGGRWPKTRPGEIDQAIASAKFVEATAGVMNTVIRTYHLIMKRSWEKALRLCFVQDKAHGKRRTISGVLRNQQFMMERSPSDIDLEAQIRVEYGLGLGRDPAQAMVLGIQASQAGFISREYVQENFEGITDVALERSRIDVERMRDMALAQLLQGLEGGTIPQSALVKIAKARMGGDDIFELYEEYVVKAQEEMQAQMLTSGLDGSQMTPGGPAQPGAAPPAAPPPEELLGALMGGGGPPGAGAPPEGISRLSVPLGGGSFMGTQAQTGG